MEKDSALIILPSYSLQMKDANRIFLLLTIIVMFCDLMLLFQSSDWKMILITSLGLSFSIVGLFAYRKFLPILLRSGFVADYYISAIIEYLMVLIGITPICLYLFVEQQWNLLNKYGTDCLFLFNRYENWLIPISVFLMISCTYWLIIHYIKKRSRLFHLLEKKKKELYE